jgi:crotonobetainyl-CoA:carnitine CoA-transferase CaiB-like acyl-CoA transferase
VLEHPQTKALDILQTTPDGRMTMVGLPVSFNGERPELRRGPPSLGADTGLILGNHAGRGTTAAQDRKKKV